MHASILSPSLYQFNPIPVFSIEEKEASRCGLNFVSHRFVGNPTDLLDRMEHCYHQALHTKAQIRQIKANNLKLESIDLLNQVALLKATCSEIALQLSEMAADGKTKNACLKSQKAFLDDGRSINKHVLKKNYFDVQGRYARHLLAVLRDKGVMHLKFVEKWLSDLTGACNPSIEDNKIPLLLLRVHQILSAWQDVEKASEKDYQSMSYELLNLILNVAYQVSPQPKNRAEICARRFFDALAQSDHYLHNDNTVLHIKRFWLAVADQENQVIKTFNPSLYPILKVSCLESNAQQPCFSYFRSLSRGVKQDDRKGTLSKKKELYIRKMLPYLINFGKMKEEILAAHFHSQTQPIDADEQIQIITECVQEAKQTSDPTKRVNAYVQAELSHFLLKTIQGKQALPVVSLKSLILRKEGMHWHPAYLRALSKEAHATKEVTPEIAYQVLNHLGERWSQIAWLAPHEQEQRARDILRELAILFPNSLYE